MNYYLLYIPGIVLLLLPLLYAIIHGKSEEKQASIENYFRVSERCMDALDRKSVEAVTHFMDEYEYAYADAEPALSDFYREEHKQDMDDLWERVAEIEQEEWLQKAEKHLTAFWECYELIMDGEMENFRDVDHVFSLKKRCISEWQNYFAVDLSQYRTTIYPKRYLREFMGDQYDPCMESHDALEKKLSDRIQSARPEYKRKKRLYDLIVAHVRQNPGIMRADLMKTDFPGFNAEEVKYCYKALLDKNRLMEYKMGSRYFVTLSDKEAAKSTK